MTYGNSKTQIDNGESRNVAQVKSHDMFEFTVVPIRHDPWPPIVDEQEVEQENGNGVVNPTHQKPVFNASV